MIANFSDHAANERTFLSWVRTGIAVIAFGFVIERFNLFLQTLATAATRAAGVSGLRLPHLSGRVGDYEGLAFIFAGVGLVVLATIRFVRTTRLLDKPETHTADTIRTELILSAVLVLLVSSYSVYLALQS
jgi:putative membrane protein